MNEWLFKLRIKLITKSAIMGFATGALVGTVCAHFNFSPMSHWICVISSSIIMGLLV